ncbi:MAG: hypothetical protein EPN98_21425 [Phenylobacterium sp.]|nr:phage minor head protein [Phenylobacterium sp.]TAL29006.1 MAG: hypothetical protein EPN98_21425 [Phenylobacterium sp.]
MAVAELPGIPIDPDRFHEAVAAIRKKLPVSDEQWEQLTDDERETAIKVGVAAQGDLVQDVFDALDRAVADGTTFEDFKAEVGQQLADDWGGEDGARLETIFRSGVMSAYNDGREEIFSDPAVKEERPYWRWELVDDGSQGKDDPCLDFEDLILPADDPFWDSHPQPYHVNCVAPWTMIETPSGSVEIGRLRRGDLVRSHDGAYHPITQVFVTHHDGCLRVIRNLEKILHVTANHPMAAQGRWVRADSLDVERDQLWVLQGESSVAQDAPAERSGQFFEGTVIGRLLRRVVPLAAIEFYRQLLGDHRKIRASTIDREIWNRFDPGRAQSLIHGAFVLAAKRALSCQGALQNLLPAYRSAAGRRVRIPNLESAGLDVHGLISPGVVIGNRAHNTVARKKPIYRRATASIPRSDGYRGLPAEVEADDFLLRKRDGRSPLLSHAFIKSHIDIDLKMYTGNVYNLEIEGARTFVADGFLVHNCRCTKSALSREEAEDEGISDSAPRGDKSDMEEDWSPDVGKYDASIRDEIESRLK